MYTDARRNAQDYDIQVGDETKENGQTFDQFQPKTNENYVKRKKWCIGEIS